MTKLFTFARTTAVAALALGAGALLIPEPAEAQGRSGFSGGGGRSMGFSGGGGRSMGFSGGGRSMGFAGGGRSMGFAGAGPRGAGFAGPRMAAPRMVYGAGARTYGQRAIASGAYGGRNFAYPTRGYRTAGVTAQHWRHRPGHRRALSITAAAGMAAIPIGAWAQALASGWPRRPISRTTAITPTIAGSNAAGCARPMAAR